VVHLLSNHRISRSSPLSPMPELTQSPRRRLIGLCRIEQPTYRSHSIQQDGGWRDGRISRGVASEQVQELEKLIIIDISF